MHQYYHKNLANFRLRLDSFLLFSSALRFVDLLQPFAEKIEQPDFRRGSRRVQTVPASGDRLL
jgi:hypothetical protein